MERCRGRQGHAGVDAGIRISDRPDDRRSLPEVETDPCRQTVDRAAFFLEMASVAAGIRVLPVHRRHDLGDGGRPADRRAPVPADRDFSFRIRPPQDPRMDQAVDRYPGRDSLGRLWRVGRPGDRPADQESPGPSFRPILDRVQRPGRRYRPGDHDFSGHHPRVPGDFPDRSPGGAGGVAGRGRYQVADGQIRRSAEGPAGGDRRRRPGCFPGLRRDDGGADGRRQCAQSSKLGARSGLPACRP